MADRIIKMILTADVQGLVAGFRNAKTATGDFVRSNKEQIGQVSTALIGVGAAAVGAVGYVVKQAASFDKAMASVRAATHAAGDEMDALREAAIEAGADTAFSASEAAQGIEELAKAGVSTADILSGGLSGALDLAAAGQLDVADAAETAASAMVQFSLKGNQVGHVADLLAAGAGKAQGSVADLGAALGNVGVVASNTGLSIEETTGFLAAMASNGITGAEAGTQFKSMLQALQSPSSTAQKALDKLNLSMYDSAGNTKSLTQFVGEYQASLQGRTQAEKDSLNATIFGSYGINAAGIAYKEGAGGIQEWIDAVNDAGYASETASMLTDHLMGDVERLGGSLETVFIQSGSGANSALREMVQGAEAVVDMIGKIPEPVLSATTVIAGAGGMAALGVGAAGKMVVGFVNVRDSIQSLGKVAGVAKVAVGGVGAALAAGTFLLSAWADNVANAEARVDRLRSTLDTMGNSTDSTVRSLNEILSQTRDKSLWEKVFGAPRDFDSRSAFEMADALKIAHEDVTAAILGNEDAILRVNAAIEASQDVSVWDQDTQRAGASLNKIIDEQTDALNKSTTEAQRKAAADEAAGVAQDDLAGATSLTTDAIQAQADAQAEASEASAKWVEETTAVFDEFTSMNGPFQAVIDKNKEVAQAAADSTASSEDSWEDFYDGQTVSSQDYISELTRQVEAQEKWAQNIQELTSRAAESMPPEMQGAVNSMMDELIRLGPEGAAQVQLLHDMSDDELRDVVALYQRQGLATGQGWADSVESARIPNVTVNADTSSADRELRDFITRWNGKTIATSRAAVTYSASGGMPGGGTGVRAPNYAAGGYTGDGGKYEPAGVVHRGEYVLTKEATARIGVDRLNNLNYGQFPGYAGGGAVGGSAPSSPAYSGPRVVQNITIVNPTVEPSVVSQNKVLQHAGEIGEGV